MPEALTPRQRQVYDAIVAFLLENQVPPTVRQIGEAVGLRSTASVQRVLDVLVAKGWINKQKGAYRTVNVVGFDEKESDAKIIPLVGNIAAGLPREAIQEVETIRVTWPGARCLMVVGNVLGEHEILPGDRLHVEPHHPEDTPTRGHYLCRLENTYSLVHGSKLQDGRFDFVLGKLVAVTRSLN